MKNKTKPHEVKINIEKFSKQFSKNYAFCYDHNDNVAGFREAVDAFDEFAPKHKEFVIEFCKYRMDFVSSDREAAAFMFTLEDMA